LEKLQHVRIDPISIKPIKDEIVFASEAEDNDEKYVTIHCRIHPAKLPQVEIELLLKDLLKDVKATESITASKPKLTEIAPGMLAKFSDKSIDAAIIAE
jgi:hypothetical protein